MPKSHSVAACFMLLSFAGTELVAQSRPVTASPPASDFFVQPGNVLHIRVWPDSSLGGSFTVEETGHVYLPLLGRLPVVGMTLPQLRDTLRERYATAMRSPVVTITPEFSVSVLGAVVRPGLYSATSTTSLFDVISQAGGFAPGADQRGIRVLRGGRVLQINAQRAIESGEAELALSLRPGDRIIVPERGPSLWGRVTWALNIVPSIIFLASVLR